MDHPLIPDLLQRQRDFFAQGNTRSLKDRLSALLSLESAFKESQDELFTALAQDLSKPEAEAFLAEYLLVIQEIRLVRKNLKRWLKPQRVGAPFYFQPCRNEIQREPFGQALIIAPWNYPVQLSLTPLLSAVAAGNTVILKPSEHSSASAAYLEKLLTRVFPPEWVSVIQGGVETTQALLAERFSIIFFTGSTKVGHIVAEAAAKNLTPTILELGGKCPAVVDSSADLQIAARRILTGKLFNAGQTCIAPDFVAVEESVAADFQAALTQELHDHPWEEEIATLIHRPHYDRLLNLSQPEGAGQIIQKGDDAPDRLHLAPRLLPHYPWDGPAMKEELFGPVLPLVTFKNRTDLLTKLQPHQDALALYLFSRDADFIDALRAQLHSGSLCINDTLKQASNLNLPFGGVGHSGQGRYRGLYGIEAFTYPRAITKRYFTKDPFESIPPRAKQAAQLRKWLG